MHDSERKSKLATSSVGRFFQHMRVAIRERYLKKWTTRHYCLVAMMLATCVLYGFSRMRPNSTIYRKPIWSGIPSTKSQKEENERLDQLPMTLVSAEEIRKYNIGPHLQHKSSLEELFKERENNRKGNIPKIVHFVVLHSVRSDFSTPTFTMMQYMCIRAAYLRLRPKAIIIHYDVEPTGSYWELIKPYVLPIKVDTVPKSIFGRRIVQVEHMSDVIRMRALLKYGGVYMDTDVLSVRSFDDLLENNDFILGNETYSNGKPHWICNAVILSQRHSTFLHRWYQSYHSFKYYIWSEHSAIVPDELLIKYPNESTTVHNKYFFRPIHDHEGIQNLYVKDTYDFSENYAVHMWRSMQHNRMKKFNMARAITTKMALSRILRPVLPHPFVSLTLEIPPSSSMATVSKMAATLASISRQSFPLYEIVIIDNSDGSLPDNWFDTVLQAASPYPDMLLRVEEGKDGPSPRKEKPDYRIEDTDYVKGLIREAKEPDLKGAWRIDLTIGEYIGRDLLERFMELIESDVTKFDFEYGGYSMRFIYRK